MSLAALLLPSALLLSALLAAALLAGGHTPPSELLTPLWEELSVPLEPGYESEAEFSAAVEWLRDRPRQERLAEIDRLIPLADAAQQQQLFMEKMELRSRGPTEATVNRACLT